MLVTLLTHHTTLPDHLLEDDFAYCGGSEVLAYTGLQDSSFRCNLRESEEDKLWFASLTTPCGWLGLS